MIVSGLALINIRRAQLMSRKDSFVKAALEGGMSWEDAQRVGEEAVPNSEIEYLNELAGKQAKTEGVTMLVLGISVLVIAFGVVGLLTWKTVL